MVIYLSIYDVQMGYDIDVELMVPLETAQGELVVVAVVVAKILPSFFSSVLLLPLKKSQENEHKSLIHLFINHQ